MPSYIAPYTPTEPKWHGLDSSEFFDTIIPAADEQVWQEYVEDADVDPYDEPDAWDDPAEYDWDQGQWDDDPSPYDGTYSEM